MSNRKSVAERSRESKNYYLYCINFHGSGLETIKNVFKTQVQTGLRRPVFIIDVEEIQNNSESEKRNSKDFSIHGVQQAIQNCCQEFVKVKKKIAEELQFNIYEYWLRDIEQKEKASQVIDNASQKDNNSLSLKESGKISAKRKSKTKRVSRKSDASRQTQNENADKELECIPLVVRAHNRVGQGELLSKRKYIEDNPLDGKLYIIIIGQLHNEFYLELLRNGQPILGIVNFVPTESNYDLMINNTKLHSFIEMTLECISNANYEYRQIVTMKPVGLFTHHLPILSPCMAKKLQRDIFDQLTWSVYDIEVLYQQYQLYYFKPFDLCNVSLPLDVDLKELQKVAESLNLQGHFQEHLLPGSCSDLATVAVYLNDLLNTCGPPQLNYNDRDLNILDFVRGNIKSPGSIFSDIVRIKKFGRFFVDGGNNFLTNLLIYNEPHHGVTNLRPLFLDYNLWKPYIARKHPRDLEVAASLKTFENMTISLPGYIQLYLSEVSCDQKIFELLETHDTVHIEEIEKNCKLYTLHRTYNLVEEYEEMFVIPSRLCFRDFTLFQKDEFLENLITPEMRKAKQEEAERHSLEQGGLEKKMEMLELDEEIFIRPNSLKALKLQEERRSTVTSQNKDVRSSRTTSRQYDKKLSIKSDNQISQDWVGLPPEHPLLKGYNLEDIRQEIKVRTSKYYFEHGHLELYTDKWCFQEMNQTLKISIFDCQLFLNRPRYQDKGISNNIRLKTSNNIDIRIFNETEANSRIIVNYPNGLSVFYHEMFCEQLWNNDYTFNEERRRIITPYGVVIVFYKTNNLILIMRYNGEVYRLYQYDMDAVEEEGEDILSEFTNNQSWENIDPNGRGDYFRKGSTWHNVVKNISSNDTSISKNSSNTTKRCEGLRYSIGDELKFLEYICTLYDLGYIHLKITTSQGRNINLNRQGKIYEEKSHDIHEWHDYFANESYCERGDGVKMIWTHDALRCYHQDGTLITTKTEEKMEIYGSDEFDNEISQSSSHNLMEEEENECVLKSEKRKPISSFKFLNTECPEECREEKFVHFLCNISLIEHSSYAAVHITWLDSSIPKQIPIIMDVLGVDDIILYTLSSEKKSNYFEEKNTEIENGSLYKKSGDVVVHLWIGDKLHFTVDQQGFEMSGALEPQSLSKEVEKNTNSDSLILTMSYVECLTDAFKYLVNQIATFYQYNGQIKMQHYFVKRQGKGFEFLEALPPPTAYTYNCGNCILQTQELKTVYELMQQKIENFEEDMNKFPRFRNKRPHKKEMGFPIINTLSVHCKIPTQLQNTQNICKFLETFENLDFKKLKTKLKELVELHLRPHIELNIKLQYSINAWQKRHQEHEKRKFMELQRKGLYHAMLKHRLYPKYFEFRTRYDYHVRYVDFFEFVQSKCQNQEVKRAEVYRNSNSKISCQYPKSKRAKSQCKYGTYDEP
ncbi:uncharacterized protein LOC133333222 [Musca vetustissima]|uniref:uncharacterized protein LOC133333222 n=1 Tax=Musca vetustissima TaxID=27455 RepID=UPI002AB6E0F9|nr:uncharacterized protein LOC133333222 [Musca vetustissima]